MSFSFDKYSFFLSLNHFLIYKKNEMIFSFYSSSSFPHHPLFNDSNELRYLLFIQSAKRFIIVNQKNRTVNQLYQKYHEQGTESLSSYQCANDTRRILRNSITYL